MEIIKYRNNTRHYYKDAYLTIHGFKEKLRIKASETEYLDIQKIFSEVSSGIEECELLEKFSKYKSLINLLIDKNIFYKIDLKMLEKHLNNDYFPWIEQNYKDISSKLNLLERVKIKIPSNFYGVNYLSKIYTRNNILSEVNDIETFQIFLDESMIVEYQSYKNYSNEIIISPIRENKDKIANEEDISERILSHFIFNSTILAALNSDEKIVFSINEFMEVTKKIFFEKVEYREKIGTKKVSLDPILNLNALEKFVNLYDSKIVSFNKNKEYDSYLQSPMQIITIQTADSKNHYFSDILYERLAEFISEVVFAEVVKRYYNTDFIVKMNDKLIHKSNFSNERDLYLLPLNEITDGDLIKSILTQENAEIRIYIQTCEDDSKFVVVKDEKTKEVYKCKIPIQKLKQVTTIVFTWISLKINLVNPIEAWFEKIDINLEDNHKHMSANDIFKVSTFQKYEGKTNNLDNILTKCGFSYEFLEGK